MNQKPVEWKRIGKNLSFNFIERRQRKPGEGLSDGITGPFSGGCPKVRESSKSQISKLPRRNPAIGTKLRVNQHCRW